MLYIKFVNMMINDSHYLLDEVLQTLPEIREVEAEIENRQHWMQLDPVILLL